MTLKCKTETVNTVEVDDLEQFIKETTGYAYEVVPNEEWSNDEQHRISVDGTLADYQHEDWKAFKYDGEVSSYRLQTILNGLCADGHLPSGTYVINVSW
jgi:hypothetical protein